MTDKAIELKPCPFCGGSDLDICTAMDECYWSCNNCDADGPICGCKDAATEKWNTRAALGAKAEPGTTRKHFERFARALALDLTQDFDGYADPVTAGAWLVWRNYTPPTTAEVKAQPADTEVGRIGDMGPDASIRVGTDADCDVYVAVVGDLEFCTPGLGGGKSPETRKALLNLMDAIRKDNKADPSRDWWRLREEG